MTPDPTINPKLAVDLSDRQAQADAAAEAARNEELRRMEVYARAWDKMMQRAFKGIYTRKMRHDAIARAAARKEAESDD